jgi:DNA-binding transcriptional ArsR family regulator
MSLSSEKRTEILQLLADGKITADEAAEILSASPKVEIEEPTPAPKAPESVQTGTVEKSAVSNGRKPKWLHVQVNDLESGKSKVQVNIPLRMVKFGLGMGRRFAPELDGVDWDDLSRVVTEEEGVLVDVQDTEDGEHVRIFVD